MSSVLPDAVRYVDGSYEIDSHILSQRLGLSVDRLRAEMRRGSVVSRVEKGLGNDAGRTRLTFRYHMTVWSIILDQHGMLRELPVSLVRLSELERLSTGVAPDQRPLPRKG
jgi:hypothetical protein